MVVEMKPCFSPASPLKNEHGLAMIETLPILIIFVVLLGFGLGFFGVVHTGIMNSMAARTYAFETFHNRSDLTLFRDRDGLFHHLNHGNRFHAIDSEMNISKTLGEGTFATTREISFPRRTPSTAADEQQHNIDIYLIQGRNRQGGVEASPAWIMIGYGMCIDAQCGD